VLFYATVKKGTLFLFKNCFSLDSLIKKLEELYRTAALYRGLIKHVRWVLRGIFELSYIHRDFGNTFANIGAREPQLTASKAFTQFGDAHRQIYQYATTLITTINPVCKKRYFHIYYHQYHFR
jgi:hypothetical protein